MNTVTRMADVIAFPVRTATRQTTSAAGAAGRLVTRWLANSVDDWGRDDGLANLAHAVSTLRWSVSVGGLDHLPPTGGALITVNARRFALAPVFAALAIGHRLDRPVRFVGRPDYAPLGPTMQRLGALLPVAEELEGALRCGELIVLGAAPSATNSYVGEIDHHLVAAAVAAGVPVVPAATVSVMTGRGARVEIGGPIRPRRRRRGPLAELELADLARIHIEGLLDEMGGSLTGTPLDWFRADVLGGLR